MSRTVRYLTRSKGCPFCGYAPAVRVDGPVSGGRYEATVWCRNDNCGQAEVVGVGWDAKKAEAKASKMWNTRDVAAAQEVVRQFDRSVERERARERET